MVELLIVISLLGVLAVAVLAAINPIEQANRARDGKYKADSSQLVAAIERYYVAKEEFPWQTNDSSTYNSSDVAVGFVSAKDPDIGICAPAGTTAITCATAGVSGDGNLISKNELKTEFRNRGFIKAVDTKWDDLMYVGKGSGSSENVYVCYVPKSKSERSKADSTITVGGTAVTRNVTGCGDKAYKTGAGLNLTPANACVVCLPQ